MNDAAAIAAVIPAARLTTFEKKAYYYRPHKGANDNGFEDALKRAVRMSKPFY